MRILTDLSGPVRYLKGVGPKKAALLKKLGIGEVKDLLQHYPRRYEDRRNLKPISGVVIGETQTIQGRVLATSLLRKRGLSIFKAAIGDGSGVIYALWFNQNYLQKVLPKGKELVLSGKAEFSFGEIQFKVSEYEVLAGNEEDQVHTKRIVPIYPLCENLYPRFLRSLMKKTVEKFVPFLTDLLPPEIKGKNSLKSFPESLRAIHFPSDFSELKEARRRLVFEEFFFLQLALAVKKKGLESREKGISYDLSGKLEGKFLKCLPFRLTASQEKVIAEIKGDMASPKLMNRLLQGDVGSGKTVVALVALLIAVENGYQVALMAPTEILAEQHYFNFHNFLNRLGVEVELLIGNLGTRERKKVLERIREGKSKVIMGTHALIQEKVEFSRLGLVVIDEQHLFGVIQRKILREKGQNPDVLVMTATPIPRTLALTLYGDLNFSVIKELPPGRAALETRWVGESERQRIYLFLHKRIEEGRQAYIVYPLIEESEKLELKAAREMFGKFQKKIFPDLGLGLIHGRMKSEEKEEIMREFKEKKLDILVATTVIGVGIDVPNASVMLIEHAERFGLSQLHQLRGRVGRGPHKSHCFLLADPKSEEARERMKVMAESNDGFLIAEKDLELRGPGEFFGTRQHGMPELKIANILTDGELLEVARKEAFELVLGDPGLEKEEHRFLRKQLTRNYKERMDLAMIS
jgi:ATP-dependent DNA helicase RecG